MSSLTAFSEHLGTIPAEALLAVVTKDDPGAARRAILIHLANRGLDPATGAWLGYPRAAKAALDLLPADTSPLRAAITALAGALTEARPLLPDEPGRRADALLASVSDLLLLTQPPLPPLDLVNEARSPAGAYNDTTARLAVRLARQHLDASSPSPQRTEAALRFACHTLDLPDPASAGDAGKAWLASVRNALTDDASPEAAAEPSSRCPVPGA